MSKSKQPTKPVKFRVIPNLSLKGKDIMIRLKNRSLILDNKNIQYSLESEFDEARRMSKVDLHRAMLDNAKHINSLTKSIKK